MKKIKCFQFKISDVLLSPLEVNVENKKITKPMIEKLIKFSNLGKLINDFLIATGRLELAAISDITEDEKKEIIDMCLKSVEIENYLQPVYQKYFTPEEILDIIAFYRTDTGKKYVSLLQDVSDDILGVVPKITLEMTIAIVGEIGKRRNK